MSATVTRLRAEAAWIRSVDAEAHPLIEESWDLASRATSLEAEAKELRDRGQLLENAADQLHGRVGTNTSLDIKARQLEEEADELEADLAEDAQIEEPRG